MSIIYPPYLNEHDLVLVVSPSGKVNINQLEEGLQYLDSINLDYQEGQFARTSHFKFAAQHSDRLKDLQWAFDHREAKAIFCARGGYGVSYLIDQLDLTKFILFPKWVIGFSDITALHHKLYLNGISSVHGPVLQSLFKHREMDRKMLESALFRSQLPDMDGLLVLKEGETKGPILGGNLSMLVHQIGTPSQLDYRNSILFIEEIAEPLYHIDRMFVQLKRAGIFSQISGLVLGGFTNTTETPNEFGQTIDEMALYHSQEFDYPIFSKGPFGHGNENWPIIHGANVSMIVEEGKGKINYLKSS